MLLRFSRRFVPFVALLLAACSSSTPSPRDVQDGSTAPGTSNTDSGTSKLDAYSPANAYVASTLGTAATGVCTPNVPSTTPFLTLGSEADPAVNASTTDGTEVTIICQVQATTAGAYTVDAQVAAGTKGSLSFSGSLSNTNAVQHGLQAGFSDGASSYAETDCTFTLQAGGSASNPSITSGRVWGMLSCPKLTNPEDNGVCAGAAEIILENCAE